MHKSGKILHKLHRTLLSITLANSKQDTMTPINNYGVDKNNTNDDYNIMNDSTAHLSKTLQTAATQTHTTI